MSATVRDDYALVTVEERTFQVAAEYAHFDETNTTITTGGGTQTSQHNFATASTLWVVNHSLDNPRPAIVVEGDVLGTMLPDRDYVNDTTIHIHHSVPRTGTVYLTA